MTAAFGRSDGASRPWVRRIRAQGKADHRKPAQFTSWHWHRLWRSGAPDRSPGAVSRPKRPTLTTSAGNQVADNQNAVTAGADGPVLLEGYQLLEKLAHHNRERIPERTVHAKGWGALGIFTVTQDITRYTKASIFSVVGKKTELIARFSTVAGEFGAADHERDVRGFSVKLSTEQGNWEGAGDEKR